MIKTCPCRLSLLTGKIKGQPFETSMSKGVELISFKSSFLLSKVVQTPFITFAAKVFCKMRAVVGSLSFIISLSTSRREWVKRLLCVKIRRVK